MTTRITLKLLTLLFFATNLIISQSKTIKIDGVFDDWTSELATYTDTSENLNGLDILEFQVTNDSEYLYLHIKTDQEFDITDDSLNDHDLGLTIDVDTDASTGFPVQDLYGSEITILFERFFAHYNVDPYSQVNLHDIGLQVAPTVTSNEFEMAIPRNSIPDNTNALFTQQTINVLFKNNNNGDAAPNVGEIFTYTFEETSTDDHLETLTKESDAFIRVLTYNTLFNGLEDSSKLPYFERIITALDPDIISFVETSNASNVKSLLDQWLPLGTANGWYVLEYNGVVTASKWAIIQSWFLTRQFPTLIDLPESYGTDLLFTNSHLFCCDAEDRRQEQVDEYVAFMLDAKTEGGEISLPEQTPFVYAGDLNLVGYSQQLTTLLTGDIRFTNIYGDGAPIDWDDTDVTSDNSVHNNKPLAYTWRNYNANFLPGKLDFIIYSDSVLEKEKSFVLETETQSSQTLTENGLQLSDTLLASDHLPVVADFSIKNQSLSTSNNEILTNNVYPNPTQGLLNLTFKDFGAYEIDVFDVLGNIIVHQEFQNNNRTIIDLSGFSSGIYLVKVLDQKGNSETLKVLRQ